MPSGRRTSGAIALLVALAVLVLGGCGGDDSPDEELGPAEWKASVYETVIREIALPPAQASMPESEKPTIYLATSDGSGIGAEVQVLVIGATKDDAEVIFTDDTADVIDEDEPGAPVNDDGLLVTVSPLPDQARRVELTVVLYFDERDHQTIDTTLTLAGTNWTVNTSIPPG